MAGEAPALAPVARSIRLDPDRFRKLYALGLNVLPLIPQGKRAAINWKQRQSKPATPEEIELWSTRFDRHNVGIITGRSSDNIVVLDVDSPDARQELEQRFGPFPTTPIVRSRRGWHLYFRDPTGELRNFAGRLPGVDFRGNGGLIVGPGSVQKDGFVYQFIDGLSPHDVHFAVATAWLLELAAKPARNPRTRPDHPPPTSLPVAPRPDLADLARPYVDAAFENEVSRVAAAPRSTRNEMLNTATFALGQLVGAGVLDRDRVERAMREACTTNGYVEDDGEAAFLATLNSGLEDGMRQPRDLSGLRLGSNGTNSHPAGEKPPNVDALPGDVAGVSEPPNGKVSQATRIVQMVELLRDAGRAELFVDPDGNAHATTRVGEHFETHLVRSSGMRTRLASAFYDRYRTAPTRGSLDDALNVLDAQCQQSGCVRTVHVRKAVVGDAVYLDLGDREWQVLVARAGRGVRLERHEMGPHDPRFRRPSGMLSLGTVSALPTDATALAKLAPLLNLPTDSEGGGDVFKLIVAWLLAALGPHQPYPILGLHGEQGSTKSTTARLLRQLVDPNKADLRTPPGEPRDLAVSANNGLVVAYDNLTHLPDWLSNGLCCLSTGGGFSVRKNYTDDEEVIFAAKRPAILTGINEVAKAPDLLQRSLLITLPQVAESLRKTEKQLWEDFSTIRPQLLSALMIVVSDGLGRLRATQLERTPRMADFAHFITACEPALGWEAGRFLTAYTANRGEANDIALQTSPLSVPLQTLAHTGGFAGTPSALLDRLVGMVRTDVAEARGWPRNARALSSELRKIAPNLREAGVELRSVRGKGRVIEVQLVAPAASQKASQNGSASQIDQLASQTWEVEDDI